MNLNVNLQFYLFKRIFLCFQVGSVLNFMHFFKKKGSDFKIFQANANKNIFINKKIRLFFSLQ